MIGVDAMRRGYTMHVGERLRIARGSRSQKEIALRAGIDSGSISRIERGAIDPTISTLQAIAGALGVSLADLFSEASAPALSHLVSPFIAGAPEVERQGGVVIAHPGQRDTVESVKALTIGLGENLKQTDDQILLALGQLIAAVRLLPTKPEQAIGDLQRLESSVRKLRGA